MRAAVTADPKTRVVITGQGIASVFGNDVNTFYNTCAPLFSPSLFVCLELVIDTPFTEYLMTPWLLFGADCWKASLG